MRSLGHDHQGAKIKVEVEVGVCLAQDQSPGQYLIQPQINKNQKNL